MIVNEKKKSAEATILILDYILTNVCEKNKA
jgi:hypothetical protein